MSTAAGVRDTAEAGRRSWPRRAAEGLGGLPPWAAAGLGVLAWVAALAAVAPVVRGYLTGPPDQRLVDLDVYRTGGLSVLRGQPLYTMLTQPPQLLPFTYPPAAALFAVPLAVTLGAWLLLPRDSVTYWTSAIFDPGRLGPNSGASDQSLPAAGPGVIWVVVVVVAVAGFAAVSRLARQSREPEAVAVTALVGVLASPVSWIHHYVVVVLVIGAILADGRARSRVVLAAGTAVYFALTIPWWGSPCSGSRPCRSWPPGSSRTAPGSPPSSSS